MLDKVKKILYAAAVLFLVGGMALLWYWGQNLPEEKVEDRPLNGSTTAYFNGIVLEVTEEYLYLEPIAEWEWEKVAKVKIPSKGDFKEFDFDTSRFQVGDMLRVAFNDSYMTYEEDEVVLGIVFGIFDWSEEQQQELEKRKK